MLHLCAGLAAGFLSLVPQGGPAPGAQLEPPLQFGVDLPLAPGEVLFDYDWDQSGSVPFASTGMGVRIEYGAAGILPLTRLLLGSDRLDEVAVTGAALVEARQLLGAEGRSGRGFEYQADTRLVLALPPAHVDATGWTLSLSLRPEPAALGRTFLELEGAARLVLQGDGRVRVELRSPTGQFLTSSSVVVLGQWNELSVAYDARLVRQLRLTLGGAAVGRALPEGEPDRMPTGLRVGDPSGTGTGFVGRIDELRVDDEPLTTERVLEDSPLSPAAGLHELRVRTSAGLRALQAWARPQLEPVIDTAEELARGDLEGVVVEEDRLTWAPGRWHELHTTTAPPPRTTHPLTSIGGRRLLLFGGETRDSHLWPAVNTGDTWIFDGATRDWRQVPGPGPSPRCHIPAAYSPELGLVLLAGGWRNDIDPTLQHSDTWVFHVAEERWEQRFPSGAPLPRTSDHVLVWHPGARVFVLLQGLVVRTYDPAADRWVLLASPTVVDASGAPSDYRVAGSTAAILDPTTNEVVLQGGEFFNQVLSYHDRTALYDLATNTFTVIDPPLRPAPRARAAFAYDPRGHRGVYFGGVRDQSSTRFDDLWTLDLTTRRWERLAASNAPAARGGFYGLAYDERARRFVLPLGRHSLDRWADDTLALSLEDSAPGRALYVFDRQGWPAQWQWFLEARGAGGARVVAWLRGGPDGVRWGKWSRSGADLGGARFVQVALFLHRGSNGEKPSVVRLGFR